MTLGQHSSSPACTALSIALSSAGRVASQLHDSRFRRLPLHRGVARRVHLHNGTVHSRRSFPRPQRFPLTRIPFRGPWSSPNASLNHKPANLTRSAFQLRYLPPVCPGGRRHPRLRPVALLPIRSSGRAANLHSSYRSFRSLGIIAFDWLPGLPVRLPNPPDLRSLPAAAYLYLAADHCSRSATFPEACCSSNLLEPSSLCNVTRFTVNEFFVRDDPFQQFLSRAFRMSYR